MNSDRSWWIVARVGMQSGTAVLAVSLFPDRLEACPTFADSMQQEIHAAKPGYAIHQLDAEKRATLELLLLCAIEGVMPGDVIMRREQETTRATRRIRNGLSRLRTHAPPQQW